MDKKEDLFVRVKDKAGNDFICPIDALKDPKTATSEELEQCIDDGTVGRYAGNIDIVSDDKAQYISLKEYLENTRGFCVLATSDDRGRVDAAVYAKPHVLEDGTLASIMRERLTHENLKSNPRAMFLFMEEGPGYTGKRIFVTKTREEENRRLIDEICRRCYPKELIGIQEKRFVVFFKVDKVLPLVGGGKG